MGGEPHEKLKVKNASIIYSAKDIPLFHTLKDSFLSRYKIYVWLKDVDTNMTQNKMSFDDFIQNTDNNFYKLFSKAIRYNGISL